MIITSKHKLAEISRKLRTGNATIESQVCAGSQWPEGVHYWAITGRTEQTTHHIAIDMRPSWSRFVRKESN